MSSQANEYTNKKEYEVVMGKQIVKGV